MSRKVHRTNRTLIHEENNFAARFFQRWPFIVQDCFFQRRMASANIVGCNQFVCSENRTDFSIQGIKSCGSKLLCGYSMELWREIALFCFNQNEDWQMIRMCMRPAAHNLKAADERLA